MRTTLALHTGTTVEAAIETTARGRMIYGVLTGRVTGTFVVEPAATSDPFDTADYYTALTIRFGDGPDDDPAHRLGRPVAGPGDVELYGQVEMSGAAHRATDDALGPWLYLRRDAERPVPRGTARAVRAVCLAIAGHARASFLYTGVVVEYLNETAPEMLRLIEHRVTQLADRLRAARLEIMLWEYRREQWTAARHPGHFRPKPAASQACADVIAALAACGLTARIHRIPRGGAVSGLRVDLPDATHLVISDRRGALPRSPAERTGWHVHQFPARGTHGPGREVYDSATTLIPDADTDAMIATIAALASQGQTVPPGWTGA
jgi:hypothetical protein